MSETKAFPTKARVVLSGLKAEEFNGKQGIIQGPLREGRQQVYVEELDKTAAFKVANLHYVERPVESLSNKEIKQILRHRQAVLKFQGMDKSDLQAALKELTTSPLEIAEWLAHANAPSSSSSSSSNGNAAATTGSNTNIQAGIDQLENMSPEMLRQQAQMMRSMPPATIRSMNPQLAHMTDAQIQQAAAQMEMMASNPEMMQMAKQQMKNMTPEQKEQYQKMMASNGSGAHAATSNTARPPTNPQEMLANMSPEQLQQQAQMMKSMPPATIRSMNPQLAHMTDEQIQEAATQMEMMAGNPELMKMASEQMKNMTPEQMNAMMKQQQNGASGGNTMNPMAMPGVGGQQNNSNMPATMDPAKMLETMDSAQIKQMMNMMKS